MSHSYVIDVFGKFRCSLRSKGGRNTLWLSTIEEALHVVRGRLHGAAGDVAITDQSTGETRVVMIDAPKSGPGQTIDAE